MKNFLRASLAVLFLATATTANANPELKDCSSKAMFSKQVANAKYMGWTLQEVQEAVKKVLQRPEYINLSPSEKAQLEVQAVIAYHNKKAPDDVFNEVLHKCMKGVGES